MKKPIYIIIIIITIILLSLIFIKFNKQETEDNGKMEIKSSAFKNNERIPSKYTCDSDNVNPPLEITNIPSNAKSLVLVVDDPDAPSGTWVHWAVWNIPLTNTIDENSVPKGAMQGENDFGNNNYGGMCPPPGKEHRYFFKIYALDTTLNLPASSKKPDVESSMRNHILDKAELIGIYSKG